MALPTSKQLREIAKVCRQLGISSFKSPEFEFVLAGDVPKAHGNTKPNHGEQGKIDDDQPSDLDLLFWSSISPNTADENTQ